MSLLHIASIHSTTSTPVSHTNSHLFLQDQHYSLDFHPHVLLTAIITAPPYSCPESVSAMTYLLLADHQPTRPIQQCIPPACASP